MPESAKIELSPYEWQCIQDTRFLETKKRIIEAIKIWMGDLGRHIETEINNYPLWVNKTMHPKISNGENLEGLPYVVLDYPRIIHGKDDFIIIRTLFWWGRHISLQCIGIGKTAKIYCPKGDFTNWFMTKDANHLWANTFESKDFVVLKADPLQPTYAFKFAYQWSLDILNDEHSIQEILSQYKKLLSA